jgi:predicted metal-dependent phosphoesterase TrpH
MCVQENLQPAPTVEALYGQSCARNGLFREGELFARGAGAYFYSIQRSGNGVNLPRATHRRTSRAVPSCASRTRRRIRIGLFALGLALSAVSARAQISTAEVLHHVQSAIAQGDADGLARFVEPRVDVAIFGVQTLYSRAQTEYVMRAFFRDHPPEQFVIQRTIEENGTWLATGRYWNRGDAHPYRVTLVLRRRAEEVLIRSIRIEHLDS